MNVGTTIISMMLVARASAFVTPSSDGGVRLVKSFKTLPRQSFTTTTKLNAAELRDQDVDGSVLDSLQVEQERRTLLANNPVVGGYNPVSDQVWQGSRESKQQVTKRFLLAESLNWCIFFLLLSTLLCFQRRTLHV